MPKPRNKPIPRFSDMGAERLARLERINRELERQRDMRNQFAEAARRPSTSDANRERYRDIVRRTARRTAALSDSRNEIVGRIQRDKRGRE